jgi:hypothetical protein
MKVLNLFSGPGAGKSTTSAGIFYLMKSRYGINCEYVSEYAKILAWENQKEKLSDQLYITAKQNRGLERLVGKVEYAITDSPLLLGIHYATNYKLESFEKLVVELFNSYDNINFFINRKKKYNPAGRFQTEEQAIEIDGKIKALLNRLNIPFIEIDGDTDAAERIVGAVLK